MTDRILPADFVSGLFGLDGRVAVVTGGGGGVGAAVCAGLAQAGAHVCVLDINEEVGEAVAEEIRGDGGRVFTLACDVTDRQAVEAAVARTIGVAGRVDVLVNSAGTAYRCPAEDFPEDQLDRVLELNLKGTYLPCQAFGRAMLAQGGGSIVNVASIGGFNAYPHASAYLASKGGVVQLTRGLALEWIGRVRVNAVAPTLLDTEMTATAERRSTITSDFITSRMLRQGRLGKPHEMVGATLFLASDASALVTGHTLPVDDGYLIA